MFRSEKSLRRLSRAGCGLVGILTMSVSVFMFLHGHIVYESWYRGGLVFVPFCLALGLVALLAAIFNWKRIWSGSETESVHDHKGHRTRRA